MKNLSHRNISSREEAVKREKDLKTGFGRKWLKKHAESGRARQAGTQPTLLEPVKDPARLEWHEVTKVAHYYLSVNALSACDAQAGMTQMMQVREDEVPYGKKDQR